MANIKIYGNDESECSLSQDVRTEEVKKPEQEAEFKVNAELLDNPEAPQVRVINNLS
ncbi:hypothetical protein ICN30_08165 [Polynucleobacter sp. 31A-FELB]|uniref:hypothetical protein n=1 Tax=Polynucleobacter sp. 31A-FELB TaxID=2689096 RepID=UPI001C0AEB79|nr:hypothetical protein [Polynucleobacter sp. 31A-FELB]MBU3587806.1 hypothetical protein [Polynucleobacter sp. 31A-FELB]